ncbi:MAG: NTP transferase domain-containing protein [Atribacterota bacterium]|nr:NTP transferase domain-containing protein [Atribacterota bacterium]MDD5638151.1 NTP transferase domain-containing protein [Atribacterota bacterium]
MEIKVDKKYKALLLAGGKSKHALQKLTGEEYKALMTINTLDSRPIIHHMIEVLKNNKYISQLYVASPKEVQQEIKSQSLIAVSSGTTLIDTLKKSISILQNEPYILIITCDLPLVSSKHIERFIEDCLAHPGFDIYYAIINKESYMNQFPYNELRRIYANLVDGSYTGGNLFLINPKVIMDCTDTIEQFILFRKHPLKMASILGRRIAIKYLKKYLSIRDLEKMVPQYLKGYTGKAIQASPEIALDIDKPIQLEALKSLRKHQ